MLSLIFFSFLLPSFLDSSNPQDEEPAGYARYERQAEVLTEHELLEVQRQVLGRCGLDPSTKPDDAPWYFHYEMGLELERRQDPQRALDALLEAVARRPEPQEGARMYGMWFIDYTPYFEIAKQHTILGNRSCAADALHASEVSGEISPESSQYQEFVALKMELQED